MLLLFGANFAGACLGAFALPEPLKAIIVFPEFVMVALLVLWLVMLPATWCCMLMVIVGHRVLRDAVRRWTTQHGDVTPANLPAGGWAAARDRFNELRAEYAAYECDVIAVLRLPALTDVSVPSTGRFIDAFAEAQALDTDLPPATAHAVAFATAADRAEHAWRAAREAAERIRLSGLSPAERGAVERALKLLTVARDSDSAAERLTAYDRARSELDKLDRTGVIHLPATARVALDCTARGELMA